MVLRIVSILLLFALFWVPTQQGLLRSWVIPLFVSYPMYLIYTSDNTKSFLCMCMCVWLCVCMCVCSVFAVVLEKPKNLGWEMHLAGFLRRMPRMHWFVAMNSHFAQASISKITAMQNKPSQLNSTILVQKSQIQLYGCMAKRQNKIHVHFLDVV